MTTSSPNINLISSKTELPAKLVAVTSHLRRVGLSAVVLSLILGSLLGVGVTVLGLRLSQLRQEHEVVTKRIQSAAAIESLYTVLLSQSAVAAKVLATLKPWERVLAEVFTIAPGDTLSSVSVDEKQALTLVVHTPSVEEAAAVVSRIGEGSRKKRIHNPLLESLELGSEGKVQLSITFVPTL